MGLVRYSDGEGFLDLDLRYIEARVIRLDVLKDEGYGERMIDKAFKIRESS